MFFFLPSLGICFGYTRHYTLYGIKELQPICIEQAFANYKAPAFGGQWQKGVCWRWPISVRLS